MQLQHEPSRLGYSELPEVRRDEMHSLPQASNDEDPESESARAARDLRDDALM